MSTRLTQRVRRSTLALIGVAAMALLLPVTSATAAALDRSTGGGAVTTAADVWMMDNSSDVGLQPHNLGSIWQSPDIKVCNTAVECAVSQNPIIGQTNYIFVKLRNPGPYGNSVTEQGELHVYRTTPGGGASWPTHWTEIGWTSVSVAPGVTTVTIPWTGVPGPGHFCLLTRWVSANDPMTVEGPDTPQNTRNNNNIAWRNVNSVALPGNGQTEERPFAIGNVLREPTRNSVVFAEDGAPLRTAGGRLVVDLGPTLFARWVEGGKAGKGIREVGRNQVEIVEPGQASLDNLTLRGNERLTMRLLFSATTPTDKPIAVLVTQVGPDITGKERADLGGVRYDVTVGKRQQ
ncbi:hypothetical protein [Micromonospora sp. NBC_01813]|uniref:hypothetical protein n=1 Tax=Micromonospora sp. NBC_01813 TaxID=2975988 RepID=UPI002DD86779|nr:hypothetical protein [Micromonospora sp. NBC_01813]WSA08994.1 hypothetical protein OG958_33380 [Micromonospora sp. NBC_01813]